LGSDKVSIKVRTDGRRLTWTAPPARRSRSGRARIRGRAFFAPRRARRVVTEHRAPVLDLADGLTHLGAQGLLSVIPLPGASFVEFLKMIAPPLGQRMPLARKSLGLPGLGIGIVHGRAAAVRLILQGSSWRARTSRTKRVTLQSPTLLWIIRRSPP